MRSVMKCSNTNQFIALIACLLLFIGIGRVFSLVIYNPVLGYANNYDMIRLQACHQIWPADNIIDITTGTPSAPIRRYTLDKHVDTSCFPSSELLFTSIGIELGKLKNNATGEVLISIKTIGLVKALFLAFTSIYASIYFYRRNLYNLMLANGLAMLVVLSDPGITLYMNTFYTEFSAVYFLYLALIGVAVLIIEQWRLACSIPLLIGLLGLGFSKPQHIPLALCIGILIALYAVIQRQWKTVPALLLCALMPLFLQASGYFEPRNESMIRVNKINLVASMLGVTNNPERILIDLDLPDNCKKLAGRNGYDPEIQKNNICPELKKISVSNIIFSLAKNPLLLGKLTQLALEQQKNWVFDMYGQVEHGRTESASHYQQTINDAIRLLPNNFFPWFASLSLLIPILLLATDWFKYRKASRFSLFLSLLVVSQCVVLGAAIIESGLMGLGKNLHLYLPLALIEWIIFATAIYPSFSNPDSRVN